MATYTISHAKAMKSVWLNVGSGNKTNDLFIQYPTKHEKQQQIVNISKKLVSSIFKIVLVALTDYLSGLEKYERTMPRI